MGDGGEKDADEHGQRGQQGHARASRGAVEEEAGLQSRPARLRARQRVSWSGSGPPRTRRSSGPSFRSWAGGSAWSSTPGTPTDSRCPPKKEDLEGDRRPSPQGRVTGIRRVEPKGSGTSAVILSPPRPPSTTQGTHNPREPSALAGGLLPKGALSTRSLTDRRYGPRALSSSRSPRSRARSAVRCHQRAP